MADTGDLKSLDFGREGSNPSAPTMYLKEKGLIMESKVIPTPDFFLDEFVKYYNSEVSDYDIPEIDIKECFVVWYNYTVGNAKALISTVRPDHKYYELTYHVGKNELYIDAYLKVDHDVVKF